MQLRDEIRRIQRETGVTTVLVTHDQEEALSISDRVAVMREGRLAQVADPATVYREPADGFVARFIGSGAVIAGRAAAGGVACGALLLPAHAAAAHAAGAAVELFLRPEHVRVAAAGAAPAGALMATVRERTFLGALTRLRLALPGGAELRADLASEDAVALAPGEVVAAWWDAARPRVLAVGGEGGV